MIYAHLISISAICDVLTVVLVLYEHGQRCLVRFANSSGFLRLLFLILSNLSYLAALCCLILYTLRLSICLLELRRIIL